MGEIADQIIDGMLGDWHSETRLGRRRRRSFQKGVGQGMWRQANGVPIRMADMDYDHLRNALRICRKRNNTGKANEILKELKRRDRLVGRR